MFGISTDHLDPTLVDHHVRAFERRGEKIKKDYAQLRELYRARLTPESHSITRATIEGILMGLDKDEKDELAKLASRALADLDQLAATGRHLRLMGKQEPAYKHGMRQGREDPVDIK